MNGWQLARQPSTVRSCEICRCSGGGRAGPGMEGRAVTAQPCCPLCGQPPLMVMGGWTQAFCGSDDCEALTWNPQEAITAEEFRARAKRVDLGTSHPEDR